MTETRLDDGDPEFPVVGAGLDTATISPATPGAVTVADLPDGIDLVHATGLELKSRSQWAYARRRIFRHRRATLSLVVLAMILLGGGFPPLITPYSFAAQDIAH